MYVLFFEGFLFLLVTPLSPPFPPTPPLCAPLPHLRRPSTSIPIWTGRKAGAIGKANARIMMRALADGPKAGERRLMHRHSDLRKEAVPGIPTPGARARPGLVGLEQDLAPLVRAAQATARQAE